MNSKQTPSLTALAIGASPIKTLRKLSTSTTSFPSRTASRQSLTLDQQTPSSDSKAGFRSLTQKEKELEDEKLKVREQNKLNRIGKGIGMGLGASGSGSAAAANGNGQVEKTKSLSLTPVTQILLGSFTHSLILGRGKPNGNAHSSVALTSSTAQPDLMPIGNGNGNGISLGSKKTQQVILPNTARHVSRAHAVIEFVPFSNSDSSSNNGKEKGSFVVKILGQNGLIVNGKRRKEGSVIPLIAMSQAKEEEGEEGSLLDFFGFCVRFDLNKPTRLCENVEEKKKVSGLGARSSLSTKLGISRRDSRDGSSPDKSQSLSQSQRSKVTGRKSLLGIDGNAQKDRSAVFGSSEGTVGKDVANKKSTQSQSPADQVDSSPFKLSNQEKAVDEDETEDEEIRNLSKDGSPSKGRGNQEVGKNLGKRARDEGEMSTYGKVNQGSRESIRSGNSEDRSGDVTMEIVPNSQMEVDNSSSCEEEDEEENQDQEVSTRFERKIRSNSNSELESESSSEGEDSDLTPSPSVSPEPKKRGFKKIRIQETDLQLKRKEQNDEEEEEEESQSESERTVEDELMLSESQVKMPPPALPSKSKVNSNLKAQSQARFSGCSSTSTSESSSSLQTLARHCISQLSPTYDLKGLLAGAIVFHRTATISATEAVKSVLAGNSGMIKGEAGEFKNSQNQDLERGKVVAGWKAQNLKMCPVEIQNQFKGEKSLVPGVEIDDSKWESLVKRAWRECLENVLQNDEMFGVIQRKGRDAGGMPLEHWYY